MDYRNNIPNINLGSLDKLIAKPYPLPNAKGPDFIVIGAQKSATTWLWEQLNNSPSIAMTPIKEIHYFDRNLPNSNLPSVDPATRLSDESWLNKVRADLQNTIDIGDQQLLNWMMHYHFSIWDETWYKRLFDLAPTHQSAGEITPRYAICDGQAIHHMHTVAPTAKLIFCIRNPVDRFWSQCLMKYENLTLAEGESSAMEFFDTNNGRQRGMYSETLLRLCQKFDPSQILLVFFDSIVSSPQQTMKEIHEFIDTTQPNYSKDIFIPINKSPNPKPMPTSLEKRIISAYRHEINTLANVIGGHTYNWLNNINDNTNNKTITNKPATVKLTPHHIQDFKNLLKDSHTRRNKNVKVFCISMQRSGTTSTGDWLESHGLIRAGSPTSTRLKWSRSWLQGEFEKNIRSDDFLHYDVFEDDPFWFPEIYIKLSKYFPESRFILLERDPDDWFNSMCRHSGGKNPGCTDIHARVYKREEELTSLLEKIHTSPMEQNLLSIVKLREHYTKAYQQHSRDIKKYFSSMPNRLFYGELEDSQTFIDMLSFLDIERDPCVAIPHSNKRTHEMESKYLSEISKPDA